EFPYGCRQLGESLVIIKRSGDEPKAARELAPNVFPELCARVLAYGVIRHIRELRIIPFPASETHQCETWRQQSPVGEIVNRGHEFSTSEIPCRAEQDQTARAGNP